MFSCIIWYIFSTFLSVLSHAGIYVCKMCIFVGCASRIVLIRRSFIEYIHIHILLDSFEPFVSVLFAPYLIYKRSIYYLVSIINNKFVTKQLY